MLDRCRGRFVDGGFVAGEGRLDRLRRRLDQLADLCDQGAQLFALGLDFVHGIDFGLRQFAVAGDFAVLVFHRDFLVGAAVGTA